MEITSIAKACSCPVGGCLSSPSLTQLPALGLAQGLACYHNIGMAMQAWTGALPQRHQQLPLSDVPEDFDNSSNQKDDSAHEDSGPVSDASSAHCPMHRLTWRCDLLRLTCQSAA